MSYSAPVSSQSSEINFSAFLFLIWGGYYKQNKISNEWKIYDIKSKKIISEGHFNTKIYEDSKLVQIEPNILLLCSNNNIYKIWNLK